MPRLLSAGSLAMASARHPKLVLAAWIVLVALSGSIASQLLAGVLTTDTDFINNPESKRGRVILQEAFQGQSGPSQPNETIIVRASAHSVDDQAFQDYIRRLHEHLLGLGPGIIEGATTYLSGAPGLVSVDRHTTIIPVILLHPTRNIDQIDGVLGASRQDGFATYTIGPGTVHREFNQLAEEDLSSEFRIGLPAALIVLLVVFGTLVAALVPVIIAFVSMGVALALTALIGQLFEFSFFVTNMIAMMGLAVGIDYSLFILARYREERRAGLDKVDAIATAGATASRAVFFSGLTVVLALVGMLLIPTTIFRSLGIGAILVVLAAVAAALTLLPALISLLGDRIDSLGLPLVGRRSGVTGGWLWDRIARTVMARPWISLALAAGLLTAAAFPMLGMKTGMLGVSTMPDHTQAKKAFIILEKEFSFSFGAKADIVISGEAGDARDTSVAALGSILSTDPAFHTDRARQRTSPDGKVVHVSIPLAGHSGEEGPQQAIRRLRGDYIPMVFEGVSAEVLVTGGIAGTLDFLDITRDYTPLVFIFVLGLSFVLLTVVFRSLIVPIKAIILNLLSVAASYGLLVLVFQKGVGTSLFGFSRAPVIEAWIPLFLFSVLFGLSMDYHVFLLSRIREHFDKTGDNDEAVSFGLRSTAGIITGAALIMVAIFSGFASGQLVAFQQVGFGLGVAVLLDATIVRSVLVPATMKVLGRRNWYLPSALARLLQVRADGGGSREYETAVGPSKQ